VAQQRRAVTELRRKKLQLKNLEAYAYANAGHQAEDCSRPRLQQRGHGEGETARLAQQVELLEASVVAPGGGKRARGGGRAGSELPECDDRRAATSDGGGGRSGEVQRWAAANAWGPPGVVAQPRRLQHEEPPVFRQRGEQQAEQREWDYGQALPARRPSGPAPKPPHAPPPDAALLDGRRAHPRRGSRAGPALRQAQQEGGASQLLEPALSQGHGGAAKVVGAASSPVPRAAAALGGRAAEVVENPLLG
jgi:hypothetical protein